MREPRSLAAIAIIARVVLLEARRSTLPWLLLGAMAGAVALSAFLAEVAVTESAKLQTALVAALLRVSVVFLVAVQTAASAVREHDDKGLELLLALPISRSAQYAGRWLGHAATAALLAVVAAIPLLLHAPPGAVLLWALSLAFEAAMVAAAALFFAMSLAQLLPAISATAALYLLARSIGAIQSIAAGPATVGGQTHEAARGLVDLIALVLPRLESVTRTDWLLYGLPGATQAASALAGLALYAALLVAAGLIDFQRRAL